MAGSILNFSAIIGRIPPTDFANIIVQNKVKDIVRAIDELPPNNIILK